MSRSKDYQKLLNAKAWKFLRAWYLQRHPLCEMCKKEGYVRSAIDVHHKIPVESAKTPAEMWHLCYNPSNLQALCISCHVKVHKEMGKNKKKNVLERKDIALQRWIDKHKRKSGDQSVEQTDNTK